MMAPNRRYELSTEFRTPSHAEQTATVLGCPRCSLVFIGKQIVGAGCAGTAHNQQRFAAPGLASAGPGLFENKWRVPMNEVNPQGQKPPEGQESQHHRSLTSVLDCVIFMDASGRVSVAASAPYVKREGVTHGACWNGWPSSHPRT